MSEQFQLMQFKVAQFVCTELYNKLAPRKIFPALTGGTLYKEGARKDIDIIMYRGDSGGNLEAGHFRTELNQLGFYAMKDYGRVLKAKARYAGIEYDFDFIIPEAPTGSYYPTEAKVNDLIPPPKVRDHFDDDIPF